MKAPFAPVLKSKEDTDNFDVEFTSCPVDSYEESPGIVDKEKFKGFSYEWCTLSDLMRSGIYQKLIHALSNLFKINIVLFMILRHLFKTTRISQPTWPAFRSNRSFFSTDDEKTLSENNT